MSAVQLWTERRKEELCLLTPNVWIMYGKYPSFNGLICHSAAIAQHSIEVGTDKLVHVCVCVCEREREREREGERERGGEREREVDGARGGLEERGS